MSTDARQRYTNWLDDVKALLGCLAGAVVLALVTGPTGNHEDHLFVFKELPSQRLVICIVLAVAFWAVLMLSRRGLLPVRTVMAVPDHVRDAIYSRRSLRYSTVAVVVGAAVIIPPFLAGRWQESLITITGIYVLLSIGLNVVVGWAGLLDLGYIAFYAIGAYTTAYFTGTLPVKPPFELNPFYIIPMAILTCLIAGVLLGAPTLRLRGDYLAIVTLGFGEIVRLTANNADRITDGPRGASGIPHFSIHIGPIDLEWGLHKMPYWYLLLVIIALMMIMFNRLENSRIGRAWAAIREDEVAAQANGVRTVQMKLLAFAIGASTAGVAGVIFASKVGAFDPSNFLLIYSIFVVSYVIFGGMGSLPGVILGATVLTVVYEALRTVVPPTDRQIYLGAILVIMMIFRPAGLLPARRRQMELSAHDAPLSETAAVSAAGSMGSGTE